MVLKDAEIYREVGDGRKGRPGSGGWPGLQDLMDKPLITQKFPEIPCA
jgi:hypothetical protein